MYQLCLALNGHNQSVVLDLPLIHITTGYRPAIAQIIQLYQSRWVETDSTLELCVPGIFLGTEDMFYHY